MNPNNALKTPIVIFLHGLESTPSSGKIQYLQPKVEHLGCETLAPDFSALSCPNERINLLLNIYHQNSLNTKNIILVGSSLGGYMAAVTCERLGAKAMLLLAPAVFCEDAPDLDLTQPLETPPAQRTVILHGWQDDLIPPERIIRYAQQYQCELHLVHAEHRLSDQLVLIWSLLQPLLTPFLP